MDGAGTRSHAPGRRMASSQLTPTGRSRGGTSSRSGATSSAGDPALAVSPARWIGVALVLGALVVAMTMAATSRVPTGSDPSDAAVLAPLATATPAPVATGEGVPTELPTMSITSTTREDAGGALVTRDREVALAVAVPETAIRARQLTLEILRDGEVVQTIERPSDSERPEPLLIREGANHLEARLVGPAGNGPAFELDVTLDTKPPTLRVEAPKDNQPIKGESVTVRGQSDPGASVHILNRQTREERTQTVGPDGRFEEVVFLEPGENVIRIKVSDLAGNVEDADRSVSRAGADVKGRIAVEPKRLSVRQLPAFVRISARLLDKDQKPVEGAKVTFTLSVPGQDTQASPTIESRADGTAVWRPEILPDGIETGEAQITMVAKLPVGGRVEGFSSALVIG